MKCPECYSDVTDVIDSRKQAGGEVVRRRRECKTCLHRYTTYEVIATPEEFDLMIKIHLPEDKRIMAMAMATYKETIAFVEKITKITHNI